MSGLLAGYREALEELRELLGQRGAVAGSRLRPFPDLLIVEEESWDRELIWASLEKAAEQALEGLVIMRRAEGEQLRGGYHT